MKNKIIFVLSLLVAGLIITQSCKKEEENKENGTEKETGNETSISTFHDTESHNMGQNCMSCHKSGGTGEGWFKAAGTVYDSTNTSTYPNATIKLYTEANGKGTLKGTILVDGNGNFYTTNNIDFGTGLFPSVMGKTETKYMSTSITIGQCNSCHGVSTNKMWAK